MENLKHTPGPFISKKDTRGNRIVDPVSNTANGGYTLAEFFGPDAEANASLFAAAPGLAQTIETDATLLQGAITALESGTPINVVMRVLRGMINDNLAMLARIAAPALLLFTLFSLPAPAQTATPGYELEFLLRITDPLGQIRFDTLRGSGPIPIADLLQNGAEITDTAAQSVRLYSKAKGLIFSGIWPGVKAVKVSEEGYYRLEVGTERVSQFQYKVGMWETWEVIFFASMVEPKP